MLLKSCVLCMEKYQRNIRWQRLYILYGLQDVYSSLFFFLILPHHSYRWNRRRKRALFLSKLLHGTRKKKQNQTQTMSIWNMRWNSTREIYLQKNLPKTLFSASVSGSSRCCCCSWYSFESIRRAIFAYKIFGFAVSLSSVTMILNIFPVFDFHFLSAFTHCVNFPHATWRSRLAQYDQTQCPLSLRVANRQRIRQFKLDLCKQWRTHTYLPCGWKIISATKRRVWIIILVIISSPWI